MNKEIKFDITKAFLWVEEGNIIVDRDKNTISMVYEYEFNPNYYFGTHFPELHCKHRLSFASELNVKTNEISLKYWGDFDGGKEEHEKELTDIEKEFFLRTMKRCCLFTLNISLRQFIKLQFGAI